MNSCEAVDAAGVEGSTEVCCSHGLGAERSSRSAQRPVGLPVRPSSWLGLSLSKLEEDREQVHLSKRSSCALIRRSESNWNS